MRIRKLLRPLIPNRIMARYRLSQHSRQVRTNVDVVLTNARDRWRWLGTTPDTFRAIAPPASSGSQDSVRDVEAFGAGTDRALQLLNHPDAEVGVVARVATPAIVGRRRVEPAMDPIAIAASRNTIAEVGGVPGGPDPLPGLLERLRDAGRRITLDPIRVAGPVHGARNDPITGPAVVIFSGVPMHDVGGGSRATQLALEFVRRGHHVTYVALFGTQESVDLGLRFIHPRLEQVRADAFDPGGYLDRVDAPGLVIVEIPAPDYRRPVSTLQANNWTVMYDVIDDWSDPELGGEWYDPAVARWFAAAADHLTVSASDLASRVELTDAVLIPNAVNADLFGGASERVPPADFPPGIGSVLGYVGSLYGSWFDWAELARVAFAYPDARVVVIGDDKSGHPEMPDNVHFLGLKPQVELSAYLQLFDVGLLPFVVSDTTHAVSPLKVYEYLASGTPVAAPPLRSLDQLDGVAVDHDLVAAVRRALDDDPPDAASIVAEHSWRRRVASLMSLVGIEPATEGSPVLIVCRPAVHYAKKDRVEPATAAEKPSA